MERESMFVTKAMGPVFLALIPCAAVYYSGDFYPCLSVSKKASKVTYSDYAYLLRNKPHQLKLDLF